MNFTQILLAQEDKILCSSSFSGICSMSIVMDTNCIPTFWCWYLTEHCCFSTYVCTALKSEYTCRVIGSRKNAKNITGQKALFKLCHESYWNMKYLSQICSRCVAVFYRFFNLSCLSYHKVKLQTKILFTGKLRFKVKTIK